MRSTPVFLAAVLAWAVAATPAPRAAELLTLPAAVETALRASPTILESQARRDAAAAARGEARAMRLPHVQVREVAVHTDAPADAFGLTLMQERFSFPEFTSSDPNDPEAVDNFATEFESTWPIFVGGRVMAGIDQAGAVASAAESGLGHTREAVALATASAYMDAVLAERSAELARRARDTTARHVDQAQAFFDAGMMVESDLLLARIQLARMDEKLIAADNGTRLARARLFQWMGVEQDRDDTLDHNVGAVEPAIATLDSALSGARARRHDVQAAQAQVNAARAGIKRAKGEYLPEVALVGRYSLNDDVLFGSNGESYSLMAIARWNVLDWGQTRARVSGARASHVAAEQAQRAHLQAVEFETRRAWQQVAESRARHEVAAGAVTQAERALSIIEARFEQGVVRIADLLDAETYLDDARVRELNARFDLQRATRSLAFATGLPPVPEVMP
jgi:outer membrane protein TolC